MVSLRALECLVTIIEQGSVTKAAAVLHMSQSALSHQIAAVERELGTPVIERLARGTRAMCQAHFCPRRNMPFLAAGGNSGKRQGKSVQ